MERSKKLENQNLNFKSFHFTDGVNNCVWLLFLCYCIQLIVENYVSYGILQGPFDSIFHFWNFLGENWQIMLKIFLGCRIQFLLSFGIEKLLAFNYVTEKLGMILHGFNAFSMVLTGLFLFSAYNFNTLAGHWWAGYIATYFFMNLSYIFENQKSRDIYKKTLQNTNADSSKEKYKKRFSYPDSVTLNNLIHFFILNSNFIYNPGSMVRNKARRNLRKTLYGLVYTVISYYILGFLCTQYIAPESHSAVESFKQGEYAKLIQAVTKLILPINVAWILFYDFWVFRCYLPMHGWFWGTEDALYMSDWWNSKDSTTFWTKWNCQMNLVFKNYFFIPMYKNGHSRLSSSLLVVTASGLLHEYLISVPFRSSYGLPFISMLLQVPLAHVTSSVSKKYGPQFGNALVLTTFSLVYTVSIPVLHYNSFD